jgi:hypothetical protein
VGTCRTLVSQSGAEGIRIPDLRRANASQHVLSRPGTPGNFAYFQVFREVRGGGLSAAYQLVLTRLQSSPTTLRDAVYLPTVPAVELGPGSDPLVVLLKTLFGRTTAGTESQKRPEQAAYLIALRIPGRPGRGGPGDDAFDDLGLGLGVVLHARPLPVRQLALRPSVEFPVPFILAQALAQQVAVDLRRAR